MNFLTRINRSKILLIGGVFIIGILLPLIFKNIYFRHLLILVIIYSILAFSLDIVIGQMGQFSFGHQVFFGLSAYTSAILSVRFGLPIIVSALCGILLSTILGFIIGLASLKKARGFLLGIITLGVGKILWMLTIKLSDLTGGDMGVSFIPKPSLWLPFLGKITLNTELSYYYFVIFWLIISMYLVYAWKRSRVGRAVEFIRENEALSKSIGINPYAYYVSAFTFASALGGLAGVLYAHYITTISPDSMSMYVMVWILAIVILGGKRTYLGPLIGSAFFIILPQIFSNVKEFRMVIVGCIILISIILMRDGIVPTISRLWKNKIIERKFKKNGNS